MLSARFLKPYLVVVCTCCYVIFLAITLVYQDKVASKEELLMVDQKRAVSIRKNSLMGDFDIPFADVRLLAEILTNRSQQTAFDEDEARSLLYSFADNKRDYGQVRFLDIHGKEIIRINRGQGTMYQVAQDKLQEKAHRGYIQSSSKLERGEVYVSPLDLNIENKQVEVPYEPVIRFTSPVYGVGNTRIGLVALNFYAANMLDNFQSVVSESLSNVMLLNDQGYWLVSDDQKLCWSFMFLQEEQSLYKTSFAFHYPEVWKLTQENPSGQTRNEKGLFTWTTVNPIFSIILKNGQGQREYPAVSVNPYHWVVVQHVSEQQLVAMENEIYRICAWAWGILCIVTAVALWFTFLSAQQSQEHREELEVLAHNDWLTGLSNLPHVFSKLEAACMRAAQSAVPFSLMYIDLDDFKFVNDRFGHEAGNIVLRHVATVLRKHVRMTDTVARIGGDEYVILLENLADTSKAEEIAAQLLVAFEEPVALEYGNRVYVKASIGIAAWSQDVVSADDLMKRADVAMYNAKHGGKNRIAVFSHEKEPVAV